MTWLIPLVLVYAVGVLVAAWVFGWITLFGVAHVQPLRRRDLLWAFVFWVLTSTLWPLTLLWHYLAPNKLEGLEENVPDE